MDIIKMMPVLVIAGCVAWYGFDKYQQNEGSGDVQGILGGRESCVTLEADVNRIGAAAPEDDVRIRQSCRTHVCGLSFMHGRTIGFTKDKPEYKSDKKDRVLSDSFIATDSAGSTEYSYSCTVNSDDLKKAGLLPVKSASFVQK